MDVQRSLHIESEAAKALISNVKEILGDDDQAIADAIEGETDLRETIDAAVERICELESHMAAISSRIDDMRKRKDRLRVQAESLRTAVVHAMGVADIKKLELPLVTVTRRKTPATAIIVQEAEIPSDYWKPQPPKLDKAALTKALRDNQDVPGATLSNGSESLTLRSA